MEFTVNENPPIGIAEFDYPYPLTSKVAAMALAINPAFLRELEYHLVRIATADQMSATPTLFGAAFLKNSTALTPQIAKAISYTMTAARLNSESEFVAYLEQYYPIFAAGYERG